ncbi:cytochrome [Mycobacterium colombiense]|uniref:cytochrome P450 n=1 Tax=Mycobacterium colombiense TaxID=339268 RepID=UPI000801A7AE|nr:cytochrome P450 [Mycobacterium colombiense]OBJ26480.1 cytochrome [Mycobacterium colombiense]OBJ68997.1 cytochrome [Mycobacterium colombiense]
MTQTLDVDLTDGRFYSGGGARDAYRWMRANRPVFRDRNGFAAVATYRAVIDAERNPRLFINAGGIRPEYPGKPYMVEMDDPEHLLRRKLVSAAFTGTRIVRKVPSIGRLCDELIDAVCESGECDFIRDIAAPLPMAVIGDMLGVLPEDRGMLLKWSDDVVGGPSSPDNAPSVQAVMDAFAKYTAFTMDMITKRRTEPSNDLFSVLVNAEIDGRRLSDDEIVYESLLILIGGDETARHTLSGGIEQLLRNRDQWETLREDPDLVSLAIEEMLRWTSPIKNMCRTVTDEIEFHGTHLHAGEKIMLLFESANFDEATFGDPDDFRIDRNPNKHLAFGFGTHFCLGSQLARLEVSLMLTALLRRLPDLRLASDAELPRRSSNFISGPESMPVVFSPSRRSVPQCY